LDFTEIYFSQRLIKSEIKGYLISGSVSVSNILMDINKREEIDWMDRKG